MAKFLRVLLIAILFFGIGVAWLLLSARATLIITNDSGKIIKTLTVKQQSQERTFSNIAAGEKLKTHFLAKEVSYHFTVEYEDGSKFTKEDGYVTDGSVCEVSIISNDAVIVLEKP